MISSSAGVVFETIKKVSFQRSGIKTVSVKVKES